MINVDLDIKWLALQAMLFTKITPSFGADCNTSHTFRTCTKTTTLLLTIFALKCSVESYFPILEGLLIVTPMHFIKYIRASGIFCALHIFFNLSGRWSNAVWAPDAFTSLHFTGSTMSMLYLTNISTYIFSSSHSSQFKRTNHAYNIKNGFWVCLNKYPWGALSPRLTYKLHWIAFTLASDYCTAEPGDPFI